MKKLALIMLTIVAMALVSCGGDGGSKTSGVKVAISLDALDDYYDVKSFKLETDVKEKGIDNLGDVKGTLTLNLKRNKTEMNLKPSDIEDARAIGMAEGETFKLLFSGDCTAKIKNMIKEGSKEVALEIPIKVYDPTNMFNSDEENATKKQAFYDALVNDKNLHEIGLETTLKD